MIEKFVIRRPRRIRERVLTPFGPKMPPALVSIETDCSLELYPYDVPEDIVEPRRWTPNPISSLPMNQGKWQRPMEAIAASSTIPHVVRISNLSGCDTPADVISMICRRFFHKIHFIYITESMSHVFVGLYHERSAREFHALFDRYGHGHTLCECKILSATDRKKTTMENRS